MILENGSSDRTPQYARVVEAGDHRVRLIETGASGLAEALNVGIDLAETPLLARMDADDIVLGGRFAAQAAAFVGYDDLVLCGTQIKRFSRHLERSTSISRFPLDHAQIVAGLLEGRHVLCHPTVVFTRIAALRVGGYWDKGVSEDADFFLRLSRLGRLANLPVCGLGYRFHGSSLNAQRQFDILIGMRLAADTHWLERDQLPDLQAYRDGLLADPRTRRRIKRHALSDTWYRAGQVRLLDSRASLRGLTQLAGAGLLRPGRAAARVRQIAVARIGRSAR
jgi:glycosyltransferase involved in cell wall biosynthesis